ncbi:MAG: hypothetical protein ABI700_19210 [Chloroflexota bacterium]
MKVFTSVRFLVVVFVAALLFWGASSVTRAQDAVPPAPVAQSSLAPLIPCPEASATSDDVSPCVTIATSAADLAGIWKTYVLANPAFKSVDGMGFIRFSTEGEFFIADTPADTQAVHENYPYGTFKMADGLLTFNVKDSPIPGCETGVWQVRVIQLGSQPVALSFIPVDDQCAPRKANLNQPAIWVDFAG